MKIDRYALAILVGLAVLSALVVGFTGGRERARAQVQTTIDSLEVELSNRAVVEYPEGMYTATDTLLCYIKNR